ncbi:MAG TPA: glycosyltransferase [Bacteroidota bacterium]|nr:glycosyltransferase [Bacteroidota bacterium]
MKIALVHDGIWGRAGGEKVLLNFHRAFPEAPIYTSAYFPDLTYPEFKECTIRTTWYNRMTHNEKQFKMLYYPFCVRAMENLDLSEYDVLLISTTNCAKYVKRSPRALVIAYCYTPFRLAWNPASYNAYTKTTGVARLLFDIVIKRLREIDYRHAKNVKQFLAMTRETESRIRNAYCIEGEIPIIPPSIDVKKYSPSEHTEDYFLVVSRLESYKRVDLVIEAFNRLKLRLKIVGRGTQKEALHRMADGNIEFLEGVDDRRLNELYAGCKALVFPQHEDFGLTTLEANACGRPVVCYNQGGVLETMIPYAGDSTRCTAIFFNEQTVDSLIGAIHQCNGLQFDSAFIRRHAEKFDDTVFIERIRNYVDHLYTDKVGRAS